MGIFGSAYNVNPTDLKNIFTQYLEQATPASKFEAIQFKLVNKALKYTSEVPYVGKVRISPAQVNNPFRNMPNVSKWLSDRTYLVFVDGGIAYNIPLRPLAKKERDINAIIVGDSWPDATELQKAFKALKKEFGYNYTRVDDQSTPTLHLYKDKANPKAPRIIYVTFIKDDTLLDRVASENPELAQIIDEYKLHQFDISRCTGVLDYCSSFSFNYTVQEFLQLMYIGFINVLANKDTIEQFLRDEFSIKQK